MTAIFRDSDCTTGAGHGAHGGRAAAHHQPSARGAAAADAAAHQGRGRVGAPWQDGACCPLPAVRLAGDAVPPHRDAARRPRRAWPQRVPQQRDGPPPQGPPPPAGPQANYLPPPFCLSLTTLSLASEWRSSQRRCCCRCACTRP